MQVVSYSIRSTDTPCGHFPAPPSLSRRLLPAVALAGTRTWTGGSDGEMLNELSDVPAYSFTHDVCLPAAKQLARRPGNAHAVRAGHRGTALVDELGETRTVRGAPVAGTRGLLYTRLRDSTARTCGGIRSDLGGRSVLAWRRGGFAVEVLRLRHSILAQGDACRLGCIVTHDCSAALPHSAKADGLCQE